MQPDNADAHYGIALALAKVNRASEAVPHFREAIWLRPDWLEVQNDFAWLLATHPDGAIRDGDKAQQLAADSVEKTQREVPRRLESWAAALAEQGDFQKATQVQSEAIRRAGELGDPTLMSGMETRLNDYRENRAFRDEDDPQ